MAKSIVASVGGLAPPRMKPERLVGMAFRHALTSKRAAAAIHKELLWQRLANEVGGDRATPLATDVDCFVCAVERSASRPLETLPPGCPGFCRDECLVISMVAASQHGACPALKACAYALLQSAMLDEPIDAARTLAEHLKDAGQLLSLHAICEATILIPCPLQRPN